MNRKTMHSLGVLCLFALASCNGATSATDVPGLLSQALVSPACPDPAPVRGMYDPRAPGYIVVFHDSVDASVETARLAETYGFTPRHVYESALRGFSAVLSPEAVAGVRCQATVDYLEYNGIVSIASGEA